MQIINRKVFKILAPGSSLKRRVAYGLAIVRLILAPVIFLTIFYLFKVGSIVNRIVNVDAPATNLAEQISLEMLQARRSERSYFLSHDSGYLQENRQTLDRIKQLVNQNGRLEPDEQEPSEDLLRSIGRYQQQFGSAVASLETHGTTTEQRVQQAVAAYEADLNLLLRRSRRMGNGQLVKEVQNQVESFDTDIAKTLEQESPALRVVTPEIQATSQHILHVAASMETQSWRRVEQDHQEARDLFYNAEWVLSIVSLITFVLSIWISFVLPRQVVKPLTSLREAVDHAASGQYPIEFELQGRGEVIDLARSIDHLINQRAKSLSADD
jgi:CHASE3 domain sensor protein